MIIENKHTDFELAKLQKQIDLLRSKSDKTTVTNIISNVSSQTSTFNKAAESTVAEEKKVVIVTTDYTITDEDVIIHNSVYAHTIMLPVTVVGRRISISNIYTGKAIVNAYKNDFIDNQATKDLMQWHSIGLECYSKNLWKIISNYSP